MNFKIKIIYCVIFCKYIFLQKKIVVSFICSKCGSKDEKIFKEELIEISKILDLMNNIEQY